MPFLLHKAWEFLKAKGATNNRSASREVGGRGGRERGVGNVFSLSWRPCSLLTPTLRSSLVLYFLPHHSPRLRAVSLFSVVRQAKRETRKWPRACVSRVSRVSRVCFARLARALLSLNLKKKRDYSQSTMRLSHRLEHPSREPKSKHWNARLREKARLTVSSNLGPIFCFWAWRRPRSYKS